jgi:hypothetical protein
MHEIVPGMDTSPADGQAEPTAADTLAPEAVAPETGAAPAADVGVAGPAEGPEPDAPVPSEDSPAPGEEPPAPAATAAAAARPERPEFVPEKFWDAARGEVRIEALARSYRELESKLGRMVALPKDPGDTAAIARLRRALGWPERPEDYDIRPSDPMIGRDPELERRLHEAGFTREQAQLVYDLAAERILPAVAEAVGELEAARARAELEAHFGGREAFGRVARQIRAWAERHLDPEEYAALAATARGVLAMHAMMRSDEPEMLDAGETAEPLTAEALQEMMRDPRYWRDRDPEFVARVTRGFEQLYGT